MTGSSRASVTVEPSNWSELQDELHREISAADAGRYHSHLAYRGVGNAEWRSQTSLQRLGGPYSELESLVLADFRKYGSTASFANAAMWDVLTIGQHFGLPTRLLDWTFSPLVALHFATADDRLADQDGGVWVVDYRSAHKHLPATIVCAIGADIPLGTFSVDTMNQAFPDLKSLKTLGESLIFFEPRSIDERVVAQYAALSVCGSATTDIEKILVDELGQSSKFLKLTPRLKAQVRERLDQANITERVLFPGLDGLAASIRRYYSPYAGSARRSTY